MDNMNAGQASDSVGLSNTCRRLQALQPNIAL